jgi:hypothetical protein
MVRSDDVMAFNAILQVACSSKATEEVDKQESLHMQSRCLSGQTILLVDACFALHPSTVGLHEEGNDLNLF